MDSVNYNELFQGPLVMICGCVLTSFNQTVEDSDGMLTCKRHGVRRYGWRDLPPDPKHYSNGKLHRFGGRTALEIERFVVFGIEPQPVALEMGTSDSPDLRPPFKLDSHALDLMERVKLRESV